jgi:ribosomal-protein-alanine N-acetyltransferase
MTLETTHLRLKLYSPADILGLIEGEAEFEKNFGLPPADGLRAYYVSGEVSPLWLAQLRKSVDADVWVHGFAVIQREGNSVIGSVGFKGPPDKAGMVEIAYGIVPGFQGRGYATEAAQAGIAFAFGRDEVRVIRAHTLPTPNASTRVLAKCGFGRIGEVTDPEDGVVWRWEKMR